MRNLLIAAVAVAMLAGCEAVPVPLSVEGGPEVAHACQTCFFGGTKYSEGAERGRQTCSCWRGS